MNPIKPNHTQKEQQESHKNHKRFFKTIKCTQSIMNIKELIMKINHIFFLKNQSRSPFSI
jgi:hypothetical protein